MMGKQNVSPALARAWYPLRHTHRPLPDRPSVCDVKNLRIGIEETVQISEVNIGTDMVNAQILDRESRREVEFSGYCLARAQMERSLGNILGDRRKKSTGIGIHFKVKPAFAFSVGKFDVAASEIRDLDRSRDRFVRHVLEPFKLQFHKDLRLRRGGDKHDETDLEENFHWTGRITHLESEENSPDHDRRNMEKNPRFFGRGTTASFSGSTTFVFSSS